VGLVPVASIKRRDLSGEAMAFIQATIIDRPTVRMRARLIVAANTASFAKKVLGCTGAKPA